MKYRLLAFALALSTSTAFADGSRVRSITSTKSYSSAGTNREMATLLRRALRDLDVKKVHIVETKIQEVISHLAR